MDDCSAGLRAEDKSVLCGHRRSRQQIVTKRPSVVYRPTLILYAQATPYATCRPTKTHMERLGDWQKRQTYRWSRDQQIMRSVNLYLGYRLILIWYKSTAALAVTSLSLSISAWQRCHQKNQKCFSECGSLEVCRHRWTKTDVLSHKPICRRCRRGHRCAGGARQYR